MMGKGSWKLRGEFGRSKSQLMKMKDKMMHTVLFLIIMVENGHVREETQHIYHHQEASHIFLSLTQYLQQQIQCLDGIP